MKHFLPQTSKSTTVRVSAPPALRRQTKTGSDSVNDSGAMMLGLVTLATLAGLSSSIIGLAFGLSGLKVLMVYLAVSTVSVLSISVFVVLASLQK